MLLDVPAPEELLHLRLDRPSGARRDLGDAAAVRYGPGKGNEPVETYALFDVSTDAATLNQNEGLNAAIFADLGSGTSYGAFDVANVGGLEQ